MTPCHHFYLIVNAQSDSNAVLAQRIDPTDTTSLQHPSLGRLPSADVPYHFWQVCEPANAYLKNTWHLSATTLRCLEVGRMPVDEKQADVPPALYYVYLMQTNTADADVYHPDLAWVNVDDLILVETPFSRENIRAWLSTLDEEHPYRPDWYRPRWTSDVHQQFPDVMTFEQVRSWERSTIWRLQHRVDDRSVTRYLKAVPPVFEHEPTLTSWLRTRFPQFTPEVIGTNRHRWLLMTDYGGQALNTIKSLDKWERAIREYGQLQVQLVAHNATLQKLGIPERSLWWIDNHLNSLLLNLDGYVADWDKARKQRLHDSIPHLHRLLARLSEDNIPNTLEHGDFWAGQIILRRDKTLFTDWSDSTLTYPFFSLPFFMVDIQHELPDIPLETIQQTLTTAYLDAWTDYMPLVDLQSAMHSARVISPLFTALRYHVDILPRMENKWEMINMVGYNLGLLLKALDSA